MALVQQRPLSTLRRPHPTSLYKPPCPRMAVLIARAAQLEGGPIARRSTMQEGRQIGRLWRPRFPLG